MMEGKQISVIIPTYNRCQKLLRALDSVFAQTRCDLIGEIIVVDDGSQDDTIKAVEEYKKKHSEIDIIVLSQKNQGPSSARNNGMRNARYAYLALLDSDDEWLPEKTAIQMSVFENHQDASFVGGNGEKNHIKILWKTIDSLHKATLKELCIKSFPVTPSVVMKKSIFDEIGGFDEAISHHEDCDYFTQICARGYGYYFVPEQVVVCDRGKPTFGKEGLSADLKKGHMGEVYNIKKLHREGHIGTMFYSFLRLFYFAKYLRRIVITKSAK